MANLPTYVQEHAFFLSNKNRKMCLLLQVWCIEFTVLDIYENLSIVTYRLLQYASPTNFPHFFILNILYMLEHPYNPPKRLAVHVLYLSSALERMLMLLWHESIKYVTAWWCRKIKAIFGPVKQYAALK